MSDPLVDKIVAQKYGIAAHKANESPDGEFFFRVLVVAESQEQADQVMAERVMFDEDYGFDYSIEFAREGEDLWEGPGGGGTLEQLAPSPLADVLAMNQLVDFVRTPEWSVSMLEDIAVIVRKARPDIGDDFDEDDERAWGRH